MCLPAIGAIAGIAGSAVSAMGAMSAANAEAAKEERAAQAARIDARSRRWEGMKEIEQIGAKYDKLTGQQIATAAKGGVDPGYGSAALLIFGETHENRLKDQDATYLKAESAAIANENRAASLEASAQGHRKAGKIAAAGSFLSGIAGGINSFAKSGGGSSLLINS